MEKLMQAFILVFQNNIKNGLKKINNNNNNTLKY